MNKISMQDLQEKIQKLAKEEKARVNLDCDIWFALKKHLEAQGQSVELQFDKRGELHFLLSGCPVYYSETPMSLRKNPSMPPLTRKQIAQLNDKELLNEICVRVNRGEKELKLPYARWTGLHRLLKEQKRTVESGGEDHYVLYGCRISYYIEPEPLEQEEPHLTERLVKNSSGMTLLPGRRVQFKKGTNLTEVDGYCLATDAQPNAIVDDQLHPDGVPDGYYFWVVMEQKEPQEIVYLANMENPLNILPELVESTHEDWTFHRYTASHKSGVEIWTANIPFLHMHIYRPFPLRIPLRIRWKLYQAIKRMKSEKTIDMILGND